MLIGYIRVSKSDGSQVLDLQRDALAAAGVEASRIYEDLASGKRNDLEGVMLANGETILTQADTAITGAGPGCASFARSPADCDLDDSGVPFVFVDNTAKNNIRYFYSVTAFDINSFQSGPSSLESPRTTKSVTPSVLASNFENEVQQTTTIVGRGTVLDTLAPVPQIDPATGVFTGPFPPANGWTPVFSGFVAQLVKGEGAVAVRLDSIHLGNAYNNTPGEQNGLVAGI